MLQICWKWVEEKAKDKSCFLDKVIKARKKPKRKKKKIKRNRTKVCNLTKTHKNVRANLI